MRYSQILAVASATLILAVPVPSPDTTQTVTVNGETYTLTFSSIGSDNSKRSDSDDTSLERRGDKVSSCGSGGDNWIPVEDFACYNDYTDPWCVSGQGWAGYRSAVTAFCAVVSYDATANRVVVPAGQKASLDIWTTGSSSRSSKALGRDFGGPTTTKVGQASIGFEIHNKGSDNHYPENTQCISNLMQMAQSTSSCYGKDNQDTKGGTYQYGSTSYHALPAAYNA